MGLVKVIDEGKKMEGYTITQAVKDSLNQIPYGSDFHGYEFFERCRKNMVANGNHNRPYDASLLRIMRANASLYGVVLKDRCKSIYHKNDRQPGLF